jgi:hypothetical protein
MNPGRYTHLLVGPDYAAFPIWDRSPRHLPGMVRPVYLGISATLVEALDEWNADWEAATEAEPLDDFEWERRGRDLTGRLQSELGTDVIVAYYADGIDAPPFDRVGFAEDHRIDPSSFDGKSDFKGL